MSEIGGARLTQNTASQAEKAEALEEIVVRVVNKIEEIDEEIKTIVAGGIEGEAIETMATTYLRNREVISDYVKKFAALAIVLYEDSQNMKTVESNANVAAGGN
ncbi:MAG: hypothetical protein E7284_02560 [Lachnospiraceae bacterium]|nr:hypothetical protein [Lachnospiraceae bacterium]